jgi:hypothetical protein
VARLLGRAQLTARHGEVGFAQAQLTRQPRTMIDALQWPAMVATLLAAWLVASQSKRRRSFGFWVFIGSNLLWTIWGWHARAFALVALQLGLFVLNVRGARKNEP